MGLFAWFRNGIRRAFVDGVRDGIADVTEAANVATETGEPIQLATDTPLAIEREKPPRRKAKR